MSDEEADLQKRLEAYLAQHEIHKELTCIVEDLLKTCPTKPYQHFANYLLEKFGVSAGDGGGTAAKKSVMDIPGAGEMKEVVHAHDESDSDEDDEDEDDVGEMTEMPKQKARPVGRRVSVSASVMDLTKAAEKVPVYEKTADEQKKISDCMGENPFFSSLDKGSLADIVGAFEHFDAEDGTVIITQGDTQADYFFLLDTGTAEAYVGDTSVKKYGHSESFGELALLYNQPRAATVKASSKLKGWKLQQKWFKNIIVTGVLAKRKKYSEFLRKCMLFSNLDNNEVSLIADSMQEVEYGKDEEIITQGDKAQAFFILEEGQVVCLKDGADVGKLEPGQYFGEIALMYDVNRQATVKSTKDGTKILSMSRKTFQNLLGPLSDVLARNAKDKFDNSDAMLMINAVNS